MRSGARRRSRTTTTDTSACIWQEPRRHRVRRHSGSAAEAQPSSAPRDLLAGDGDLVDEVRLRFCRTGFLEIGAHRGSARTSCRTRSRSIRAGFELPMNHATAVERAPRCTWPEPVTVHDACRRATRASWMNACSAVSELRPARDSSQIAEPADQARPPALRHCSARRSTSASCHASAFDVRSSCSFLRLLVQRCTFVSCCIRAGCASRGGRAAPRESRRWSRRLRARRGARRPAGRRSRPRRPARRRRR